MRRQGIALTVLALSLGLLAGCGGNNSENGAQQEGAASGGGAAPSSSAAASPSAAKEPTKIQIGNLFPNLDVNNPVMKELSVRTNTTFDLITVTGDRNQKFDLWLASGDYPEDTLVLKPDYVEKYRTAGALMPLDDLIEQYGPNIKEKYGKYFDLLRSSDGHIYSLYVPKLSTEPSPLLQANFAVRYDVLEDAGYPEIKTFDQLYDLLNTFYESNPSIDGKETIPFAGFDYYGNGADNLSSPTFDASGLVNQGNFTIDDENNAQLLYSTDEMKRYYQFLSKLYNSNMLDKEFFTLNSEGLVKKITEGRVLAGYFPSWWVQPEVEKVLRASGDYDHQYAYFPITFDSSAENKSFTSLMTRSNWNWVISSKSKHPEEVMKLLDYIFSDEGQILINWGIEGRHFEVKDGKRTVLADFNEKKAANPDLQWTETASPFMGTSIYLDHGTKLADGDYATPTTKESVISGYDDRTKEVLAKYGKEVWSDFLPKIQLMPALLYQLGDIEDVRADMKRLQQAWLKDSPKIIFSKDEQEFDAKWDSMQKSLEKEGAAKATDAYEQLWATTMERYQTILQ
ncbi:extracellular solute-binding protein [Cohnella fermenti]|uniref:extracellular solute-binding protein n=1 Tax=Cohnella fermenti TaxID=2565925 RepID=UPI001454B861|nr:extracellular solute-binding protein [Cohnella fermenti]